MLAGLLDRTGGAADMSVILDTAAGGRVGHV